MENSRPCDGIRVLAVTSSKRSTLLPDVPTLDEAGLRGYEYSSWQGVLAPAAVPKDIVARLNAAIVKSLKDPGVSKLLDEQGVQLVGNTREQATAYVSSQLDYWGALIRKAGIKAD